VVNELSFVVPGELSTPTGGYVYDRRIIEELRRLGWHVDLVSLGDGFPRPTAEQRELAAARLREIPNGRCVVVDGLAYGVLPEEGEELCGAHPVIALVHHPLALETGVSESDAERLRHSERAALACTSQVIVTSAATKRLLVADYGVAAERIAVVLPGTDASPSAEPSNDGIVRLLAVGAVVPRKGYDVLLAALARMPELPWTLSIAGDRTRDRACATQIDADIARLGLAGRVHTLGAISDPHLTELYQSADVFVLPSRFEGYGMAFAEAVAHGLPVIGTTAGAIPETLPHGAGVLVPPDDAQALAAALRRLIEHPSERDSMAARARAAISALPRWTESARLFAQVIEGAS
jgi:glycosyltransferase involved in cell wall biosynthesis